MMRDTSVDPAVNTPPQIPQETPFGPAAPSPRHTLPRSRLIPSPIARRDTLGGDLAPALPAHPAFEQRIVAARPRLVRLARLRGVPAEAADDVAQDTLLEAWRTLEALRNPDRIDAWLDGICRNVCRRWSRARSALTARQQPLALLRMEGDDDAETDVADPRAFDPEEELTRQELATLLDRALAHVHPTARQPLTLRYIAGLAADEIAERMGISTSAVEVRLHRARRELRHALTGPLHDEALAFDLRLPAEAMTQRDQRETRIWCPLCGARHLAAEIDWATGYVRYSCLICGQLAQATSRDLLAGVQSYKPILSRLLTGLTDRFTRGLVTGKTLCYCGRIATAETRLPDGMPAEVIEQVGDVPLMYLRCPVCGLTGGADIVRLTVDRLETQRFWREHPRIRVLPPRDVETAGMAAVVMRVESLADGAKLDLVWARETLLVLGVYGKQGNG